MPLILPEKYLVSENLQKKKNEGKIMFSNENFSFPAIRLAIINIMPEAEKYEESILMQFVDLNEFIEIVFIRLINHKYKSSDKNHLNKFYITFNEAILNNKIDGLIITGAPVELLEFKSITYYWELIDILNYANENIKSTLGICWGGILIGHYLEVQSQILSQKLFGVFPAKYTKQSNWLISEKSVFHCPQSRYAGLNENELLKKENAGKLNILCKSDETGCYIFESINHKMVGHLGHPEYEPERLIFEYQRDLVKKLNHFPKYFDVNKPDKNWQTHANDFFKSWINLIK